MEVIKICNGTLIGDPCHIIRSQKVYDAFMEVVGERKPRQLNEWLPFDFHGITGQIYHTDHDGFFFDVPVDSGMVINISEEDLPALLRVDSVDLRAHLSCKRGGSDEEDSEMMLEGKRDRIVRYCYSVFDAKVGEEMVEKFRPIVARWDEETVNIWLRWGMDKGTADRIQTLIRAAESDPEEIHTGLLP
jgi:hypothetical protein